LGGFLSLTQPRWHNLILNTTIGHWTMLIVLILEVLGILTLVRMLRVNV
jgi:Flp pilus assembly protein TadB